MKTTLEMFKEIEDLELASDNEGEPLKSVKDIVPNWCNKIEEAIQRLDSIDNANLSEALECLEEISKEEIVVRNRSSIYMNPDDNNKGAFTHLTTVGQNFGGAIYTIKQALLKAQEQEKENKLLKGQMKYVTVVITEFQKILRTIKEKCLTNCNLALVKDNLHYQNYCKEFEYFLNKYNESPNGFEITKEDLLTQEEFELLKEMLE